MRDHFGLYRQYTHSLPSFNPDNLTSVAHLSDSSTFMKSPDSLLARPWWSGFGSSVQSAQSNYFTPFLNATTFRLMLWFYSGSSTKSLAELDRLVNEVILAEDFDQAHLKEFRALKENHRLDSYQGDTVDIRSSFSASDGWKETSVKIRIPADGVKHVSEDVAPEFDVPGLFYRRPLEVIKAAFRESTAEQFHLTPFETFYQPSDDVAAEKIYGEVYNSSAMLEEHKKIYSQPREGNCTLETVVAAVMLWSDSTHLASFGTASLWPIYMFLGNQSKYARAKSTSFAAHHLAYIPKARVQSFL
ncbi:hypothetical protein C8R48DRAFT_604928 [Suillus tomentosus]|nr:hypothetical protein C8R48DRAFT_604928 [Suillus tomentosus]